MNEREQAIAAARLTGTPLAEIARATGVNRTKMSFWFNDRGDLSKDEAGRVMEFLCRKVEAHACKLAELQEVIA